ncbi:WD40 repeat-like protein [Rhizoclosmatium globosum]|uniref:WD40 repeat-like protein n=1 Tax=Rhizoclosmatium globosum TaxID=329046 RepID=A0A1Y2D2R6_9FUNG|nr:WD40 repeat-like protein [Rhizoclosmatium globosum]|eukprot:ORY53582.1 WD40 repeat-like protein [Rhizoclosmatium globosum]
MHPKTTDCNVLQRQIRASLELHRLKLRTRQVLCRRSVFCCVTSIRTLHSRWISDKLRLMNLLIDDIRPFREFTIRGCRECRFSNGGQYFAAVHGNTIQIYSTWRFENLGNLKGHNGKVRSIHWSPDDSKIVTAGMDGAIYDWVLKDMGTGIAGGAGGNGGNGGIKREGESILKSCSYSCAVASPDGKSIYAVGSDKTLKEIVDSQILRELESDSVLIQVALSHSGRMMFVGTANGTIRSMKFPLEGGEYQEHQCHSGAITKLRVSYDDTHLFSTSDDGCVYVFKIADKEGRGIKREREVVFADEILVTKSDLEEKNQMMNELKTRVEELKMENEYQLRLKDMNFNEKIKEVTEKFMQEIEALKITSTVLRTDKEKEEVRHEEEVCQLSFYGYHIDSSGLDGGRERTAFQRVARFGNDP